MASLDWSQCPAVESIPGKVGGAWVFRGTRVPVSAIFENLKTSPIEEVLENFHVTREQVQTVLDFAASARTWYDQNVEAYGTEYAPQCPNALTPSEEFVGATPGTRPER